MNKHIDEVEFVIFDTETTGLNPEEGDRIVEIAAVRLKGGERLSTFEALVSTPKPISEAAFQVNRITPEMLKGAPEIKTILPGFLNFIQGSCLCSYNAGFDLEFLNNELKLNGMDLLKDTVVIDILKMAKRLMPGLERYALWFVADKLGISTRQEHRAFSDVELTLDVFSKLKTMFEAKGMSDFLNFSNLFGINRGLLENIDSQKMIKIQEAIDLGLKLKIRYLSSSNAEVTQREVIPKEIRQERNSNYLVGYCELRRDERSFRIDNILQIEVSN